MQSTSRNSFFALDESHRPALQRVALTIALLLVGMYLAWALPAPDAARGIAGYLPLHILLETASIVIAMMVFIVGWHDHSDQKSINLIPLACVFFGVAFLDFTHTLSFYGMPDFVTPNGPDKAIYFWLTARAMAALGLLTYASLDWKPLRHASSRYVVFLGIAGTVAALHWLFLFQLDSTRGLFLVPGKGLTPLKQNLEYAIIALNIASICALWFRMRKPQPFDAALLFGAVCAMAISEFFFTLYAEVTDVFNLLGHIYKVISYLFIYRAFVATTIEQPYRQLSELQAQQQGVLDAIPDLLFEVAYDGRIYDYHSPRTELLAAPPEVFMGQPFDKILPPAAAKVCRDSIDEAARAGHSSGAVYSLDLAQGVRWFELSVSAITQRFSGDLRFIVLARDITARKHNEEATRIAATAFESLQGMMITDANQRIQRVNRAFTRITGFTADESVGETPRLLRSGRHDAAFYQSMWASITNTGAWQGEVWNRRKNGEVYPEWLTIATVKDEAGAVTHYVGAFDDTTARKAAEDEIQSLAFSDTLTGLPNRRHLIDRLQQALASSRRHQRHGALILIDLDNFKTLNDSTSHAHGDKLLQLVANDLVECVREGDTVSRIGGDDFVVLLEHLGHNAADAAAQAEFVAGKVVGALSRTYQLDGIEHHSSASVGVTLFDLSQHTGVDESLKQAELAMYQAKLAGGNGLQFFDPHMQAVVSARAALEVGLREAILKHQFELHYQAQVTYENRIVGVEALVRWLNPQRGMVAPAEFIPLAEETGLILPIGAWVMETACEQLVRWAGQSDRSDLTIAVNVSARQFHQPDFVEQVVTVVERTGANPRRLKLELTESLLVNHIEAVIDKMQVLKAKGIGFSLDDFGTGYSSLAYLKRMPLDQLKIDQGFVRDILVDTNDAAIAKMVIALAESMGLAVIAEGVETNAQREALSQLGCKAYQGYLYSRALPIDRFEAFASRFDSGELSSQK